jgi:hypothetical protein
MFVSKNKYSRNIISAQSRRQSIAHGWAEQAYLKLAQSIHAFCPVSQWNCNQSSDALWTIKVWAMQAVYFLDYSRISQLRLTWRAEFEHSLYHSSASPNAAQLRMLPRHSRECWVSIWTLHFDKGVYQPRQDKTISSAAASDEAAVPRGGGPDVRADLESISRA